MSQLLSISLGSFQVKPAPCQPAQTKPKSLTIKLETKKRTQEPQKQAPFQQEYESRKQYRTRVPAPTRIPSCGTPAKTHCKPNTNQESRTKNRREPKERMNKQPTNPTWRISQSKRKHQRSARRGSSEGIGREGRRSQTAAAIGHQLDLPTGASQRKRRGRGRGRRGDGNWRKRGGEA